MGTQNGNFTHFCLIPMTLNKNHLKMFSTLAARAVFVCAILPPSDYVGCRTNSLASFVNILMKSDVCKCRGNIYKCDCKKY
jgi:hypothetical protein